MIDCDEKPIVGSFMIELFASISDCMYAFQFLSCRSENPEAEFWMYSPSKKMSKKVKHIKEIIILLENAFDISFLVNFKMLINVVVSHHFNVPMLQIWTGSEFKYADIISYDSLEKQINILIVYAEKECVTFTGKLNF